MLSKTPDYRLILWALIQRMYWARYTLCWAKVLENL